jgi:DNA-binding NtrC family response regulator
LDDDEEFASHVKASLATDFAVEVVSEVKEIPDALRRQPVHVVVFDSFITGFAEPDGLVPLVREAQPDADLLVITAAPALGNCINALRARAVDYIAKPCSPPDVRAMILRCLVDKGLLRQHEQVVLDALGSFLREKRRKLGLTLQQVAYRSGVSLGYLSQVELSKNSPSIETLHRLACALQVSLGEMFNHVAR